VGNKPIFKQRKLMLMLMLMLMLCVCEWWSDYCDGVGAVIVYIDEVVQCSVVQCITV
jgi:hypothetical protein